MTPPKVWPWHPLLFAAHPVLFVYWQNRTEFAPEVVWGPLAAVVLGAAALWALLSWLLRGAERGAFVTSVVLLGLFAFGPVRDLLLPLGTRLWGPTLGPGKLSLLVWLPLLAGAALVVRRDLCRRFTASLNLASTVLVSGVFLLPLLGAVGSGGGALPPPAAETAPAPTRGPWPDIYYLVLDSYAGHEVLRDLYRHDNSAFLDHLRQRGFFVAQRSRANYASTELALSSALNLDYLPAVMGPLDPASHDHAIPRKLIVGSRFLRLAKARGYRLVAFETPCWQTTLDGADVTLGPRTCADSFQNCLLQHTPLPRLQARSRLACEGALREQMQFALQHLPEQTRRPDGPLLVFAHLFAGHAPYVFDRRGNPAHYPLEEVDWRADRNTTDYQLAQLEQAYVDQVTYLSSAVQQTVDDILARATRPTVIILHADHGPNIHTVPGDLQRTNVRERMSIFSAVYLPDRRYGAFRPETTPVNLLRGVLASSWGLPLPPLPDRSYYSFLESPYALIPLDTLTP